MVYVVTMGMSLKQNFCRKTRKDKEEQDECYYKIPIARVESDIEEWLKKNEREACAELQVLLDAAKTDGGLSEKGIVYLLSTDDTCKGEGSRKLSLILKKHLERQYNLKVEVKIIGRGDKPVEAIIEMWKTMMKILEENSTERIKLIISGGYKWMSGYAITFGVLHDVDSYYSFEGYDKSFLLPGFPISWDLPRLFVFKVKNELRDFSIFKFEDLERLRETIPYREPLVHHLQSGEKREWFQKSIPIWSNLWIGDLIPETVEHSKNHSRRILDRLELMIEQGFKVPGDINDEFFTIMISSAYLHDIGHTVMEFEGWNLRDYPNAVREIHNITSVYEMVKDREFLNLNKVLTDDEFKAILLVSLYHRKLMKLGRDFDLDGRRFVKKALEKLKKYLESGDVLNLEIGKSFVENLKKNVKDEKVRRAAIGAAALLKFLDELDVQADRIVDDYYMKVRFKRIISEVEYLIKSLKIDQESEKYRNKLNEIISKFNSKFNKFEEQNICESSTLMDDEFHKFKKEVYEMSYSDIIENSSRIDPALVKAYFKLEQFDHFAKHANVLAAYPCSKKLVKSDERVIEGEVIFKGSIPQYIKESVIEDFKEVLNELKNFESFHEAFGNFRFGDNVNEKNSNERGKGV